MKNPLHTPFAAIFQTELLLNSRRVAPYFMAIFFGANAWLWTAKGAAVHSQWAINSNYFIVRNLLGFSFLTLPLFTALIMTEPVSRDFRLGTCPLIFSKPVSRVTYLAAKFSGNFFVLAACQTAFILTMIVLQVFPSPGMIVQPFRLLPFFKHLVVMVFITHLLLAALTFTVGTITRNAKVVYGLTVMFYPLYIAHQLFVLKGLSKIWRAALDPLLMNWAAAPSQDASGEYIRPELMNQLAMSYDAVAVSNRTVMILATLVCLIVLYFRFSMNEESETGSNSLRLTTIKLSSSPDWLIPATVYPELASSNEPEATRPKVEIPNADAVTVGFRAIVRQWSGALANELRLLRSERGLVIILPLAILACVLGLAARGPAGLTLEPGHYPARAAELLLIFLAAIAIVFTGESMHRDRELRIESLVWSVPIPNLVLWFSKFAATFLLAVSFGILIGLAAMVLDLARGEAPFDLFMYLRVYTLIIIPNVVVLISAATVLNVLLREKYVSYAVGFGISIGLFYLFSQGHNHWIYNLVLHERWLPSDLTGASLPHLLMLRLYAVSIAGLFLLITHLCFPRRT